MLISYLPWYITTQFLFCYCIILFDKEKRINHEALLMSFIPLFREFYFSVSLLVIMFFCFGDKIFEMRNAKEKTTE